MQAIGYSRNLAADQPDALVALELARPEPQCMDLLVEVHATSVNPVDTKVRAGAAVAPGDCRVLGWDACGVVAAMGAGVEGFAVGERVWYAGALQRPGSNAEFQCVDARLVARAPASWSDAEAAALPLTGLTAWESLFERLGYTRQPSAWNSAHPLLLINGAGGVGSITLQLCRLAGIPVTATAGRSDSRAWCTKMGADNIMEHGALAQCADNSFARILCAHDTDAYFALMSRLVAPQGLICGLSSTRQTHDLQPMMSKSAGFVWEFMFTRAQYQTADMQVQGEILGALAELADAGRIVPTLTATTFGLSVDNLRDMHLRQEAGGLIGKQALVIRA
jgi:zinc-binding alcohol dehydrogenase family protein